MTLRSLLVLCALALPLHALAAQRAPLPTVSTRLPATAQQAPRTSCPSPDGPQPEGTIRCEMCPAAPGARVQNRPVACTNGKWVDAGPCADGDCAGRTY